MNVLTKEIALAADFAQVSTKLPMKYSQRHFIIRRSNLKIQWRLHQPAIDEISHLIKMPYTEFN